MKKFDQTKVGTGHRPLKGTVIFSHKNDKRGKTRGAKLRKELALS